MSRCCTAAGCVPRGPPHRSQPRSLGPKRVPQTQEMAGDRDGVCLPPPSYVQRSLAAWGVNPPWVPNSNPAQEGGGV